MRKIMIIVAIVLGVSYYIIDSYIINNYVSKKISIDGAYKTSYFHPAKAGKNNTTYLLFAKGKIFRITEGSRKDVRFEEFAKYENVKNNVYKISFNNNIAPQTLTYKVLSIKWHIPKIGFFEGIRVIEPEKERFLREKVSHLIMN